jgi:hypothetical protein
LKYPKPENLKWIRTIRFGGHTMTVGSGLLVIIPHQQGHVANHVYKEMWQTTSTRTCGRPCQNTMSIWTCGRPCQQTTSTRTRGRPCQKIYISRPCQKRHLVHHVSKYTWHNQMMTSVKRKLACTMSTSDIRKLCHSGIFSSEVSAPRNVKTPEVSKDEGPKSLSAIDLIHIGS